jgi:lysophospholipase L1-like esterase
MSLRSRTAKGLFAAGVATATAIAVASTPAATPAIAAESDACGTDQWVTSWTASPSDNSSLLLPGSLSNQTVRMVITPHLGGSSLRLHLTNRFGASPFGIGHVTIAPQSSGSGIGSPVDVTFGGGRSVTLPARGDVVSDPVELTFQAFTPLAVSIYVPNSSITPTRHWNANATSYYANAGTGDLAAQTSGTGFGNTTDGWVLVNGLDVMARARAVVMFGDSITDGFVASNPFSIPADSSAYDKNGRYPDVLQRRVSAAGLPISVVNAGISANQVLVDLVGDSGRSRLDVDALQLPGAEGVLVLEGINDFGLNPFATPALVVEAFTEMINEAHAAGKRIWLGTILPASNALVDGVLLAPNSERYRQTVNAWIRTQRLADGVVDFDAALRDPAHPDQLLPAYAGPDNLHPSLAGYQRMADTVPLDLLSATPCP